MAEKRDNNGVLFKNDKKEKDTHADYRGTIMVAGIEYWLNAWVKESKDKKRKYFSLSVKKKEKKRPENSPEDPPF